MCYAWRMKNAKLLIAMPLLVAISPFEAEACRISKSFPSAIDHAYAANKDLNVAVVSIKEARIVKSATMFGRSYEFSNKPWRAAGVVERMVVGKDSPQIVLFTGAFTSCGSAERVPVKGERWVIYFKPGMYGGADDIVERFPLALARKFDPRIQSTPR